MTRSKRLRNAAWRHFIKAGLIPDDGQMWVLHHKDVCLKDRDPARYHEWRPEDLVPMPQSEHVAIHRPYEKAQNAARSEKANAKRAESNRHPRGKYVIRQTAEERAAMKKRLSEQRKGNRNAEGRVWVNDGVISLMVRPGEIPPGFRPGRIYRRKAVKKA